MKDKKSSVKEYLVKMLKCSDIAIGFAEVPDEIALCINISNCPCHCEKCHSAYLADDVGIELTHKELKRFIEFSKGISCVCFMGGDADSRWINALAWYISSTFPDMKVAWYSGRDEISKEINLRNFDYIKVGPYIEEKGPLNKRTTNQKFYKVVKDREVKLVDITYKFWRGND